MALLSEGLEIGDFLIMEMDGDYSREKKTVKTGATIALGAVLAEDSGLTPLVADVGVDDVQTIGITGTLTAGSFTLTFVDLNGAVVTTDPIAYNANTAAIQAGVDTALGGSICVVSGTAITGMIFTFSGTGYTDLLQTVIVVDSSDLTGVEDVTVTHTTLGSPGGSASDNNAEAIALEAITTAAASAQILCLVRGAVVNKGQIGYGAGTSAAVADTALAALNPPILVRTESTVTTTQST